MEIIGSFSHGFFKTVTKSDLEGLIFTYVWAFDKESDWQFVEQVCEIFETEGASTYFVELEADLEERLQRNNHPHRLKHKPTK